MARNTWKRHAPLICVIVLFFGFQIFALHQLMVRNERHKAHISNVLWISAQLETEYLRFMGALDRFALGDGSVGAREMKHRFDILVSRLPLFLSGEKGQLFSHVAGAQNTILAINTMIEDIEPRLSTLLPGDTVEYRSIRDQLDTNRIAVHKMVLDTFLADEAITELILEEDDFIHWILVACLLGGVASGASLVILLVRQVGRAQLAEADARHERNRAIEADKVKSEFLANMSHELRTPLNAIIGFAEVMQLELLGKLGNDRYRSYVEDIRRCATTLVDLIQDILDLSKVEAGKYELQKESVDLSDLARSSLRMVQHQADTNGIALSFEAPANLPRLHCDPKAVQQIMLNLLSNAIKFTQSGGRVSMQMRPSENVSMVIAVADDGIGMSKSEIQVALAPFGQVANVMTKRHPGTGLGLPLAKSLAELHGGRMEIESEANVGTRVTITLPLRRASNAHLAA